MANRYVLDILINAKDNASSVLDGVGKSMGGMGKMALGLAGGGLALVGTALAGAGAAAFSTANQMDAASDQMAASLGLTGDEAGQFEQVMEGVFRNNFGDGFEDIAGSIVAVESNLRRLSDRSGVDMQAMTEQAIALRDVYGEGVNETTSAAATLMENFGLSGQEAMDFIAKGFQSGLNASGDFLDTIGEYSVQFKDGGATAGQFFSLLASGMQGGMLGTDKAADAFKEFRVRIQDGSKMTAQSLAALGIDADELGRKMADGSVTAADAFRLVLDRLRETDDANLRMQAGVGLIGTQFEDLGQSAILALDAVGVEMEHFEGATDSLNAKYDNLGSAVEGYKRRALLALAPVGEKMLEFVNDSQPLVESFFSALEEHGPAAMEAVGNAFSGGLDWIEERLGGNNETVQAILDKAGEFWDQHGENILTVLGNLGETAGVIFDQFIGNILDIVDFGLSVLTGDWEGAGDALERIWERTKESGERLFQLGLDSILTLIDGFVPGFKEKGQAIIDGLLDGLKDAWQGVLNWFGGLRLPALPGASAPGFIPGVPGFATGTSYAPGGWAMVGERGPELVNLPRGAEVLTARQTGRAMGAAQGGSLISRLIERASESVERTIEAVGDVAAGGLGMGGPSLVLAGAGAGGSASYDQRSTASSSSASYSQRRDGDQITINIYGAGNPQETARSVERGVLSAKRRMGL